MNPLVRLRSAIANVFRPPNVPPPSVLFRHEVVDAFAGMLFQVSERDPVLALAGKSVLDLKPLMSDDEIGTAMETRRAAVLVTPWRLENEGGANQADVDFAWQQFEEHGQAVLTTAWNAIPFGYSVAEYVYQPIVYEGREGLLGIVEVSEKPFNWFQVDRDGTLWFNQNGIVIREEDRKRCDTQTKFLLTVHGRTWSKPQGDPLLARVYWPWFMRSHGWRFWAKFLERSAAPLLVGTAASSADVDALLAKLQQANASGAFAMAAGDTLTSVGGQGTGEAFKHFSGAVDRRIQKAILGQTLTTDVGDSGSRALGDVHDKVRDDRKLLDNRLCQAAGQRFINALWIVNRFPGAPPRLVLEAGEGLGKDRADRDAIVVGDLKVQLTRPYFERAYDFEPDEFLLPGEAGYLAPPKPPQAGNLPPGDETDDDPSDAEPDANEARLARAVLLALTVDPKDGNRFTPGQQQVEKLVAKTLRATPPPIAPARLREIALAATSPQDLAYRLADELRHLDADETAATIARVVYAADVMGYVQAERQE
jgi:phage gp29-like protein